MLAFLRGLTGRGGVVASVCTGAMILAERFLKAIHRHEWPVRDVTISVGVASLTDPDCCERDLLSAADKALYVSKAGGRNRVSLGRTGE